MRTIIQTLAGNNDFNGTANNGLVVFEDSIVPPVGSLDLTIVLVNVVLQGDGSTNLATFDCRLFRNGGAATEQIPVAVSTVQATGFTKAGCRIPVPRDESTTAFLPWRLSLVTTGKTIDMSFIVSFELGQAVTDG